MRLIDTNYMMEIEVQFTGANYTQDNEELCIYTGTQDAESLTIEVWDGSWKQVASFLSASSWNNISVATYLISSTLTVRFKGGTDTGDASESTWQIDSVLLHTWNGTNYEIQWEHQCWETPSDQVSYKIAVYGNISFDAGEEMNMRVWNYTSSGWDDPMPVAIDILLGWYNNTIKEAYHINEDGNTTWRYYGSSEVADATQSTFNIDQAGVWYQPLPHVQKLIVKADGNITRDGVWGSEPFRYSDTLVPAGTDILSTDWWYGAGNTTYYFNFTITWGDMTDDQFGLWLTQGENTSIEKISCASGAWRVYVYDTENINDKVSSHESGHASDQYGNVTVGSLSAYADYWFKAELDIGEGVLLEGVYRGDYVTYQEGT